MEKIPLAIMIYNINMNDRCKILLKKMETNTTQHRAKIARILLKEDINFQKITEFSKIFNISSSSAHRFVKSLGYPSFKHFCFDYNGNDFSTNHNNIFNYKKAIKKSKEAKNFAKKIQGDIFIITSRRGKSLAKFFRERLNYAKISNHYYHEANRNIKKFLEPINPHDTIILFTLNGHSFIVSQAIQEIAKMKSKPKIIIITAAEWMKIFEKYDYFSLRIIENVKYDLDTYNGYNQALGELIPFVIDLLNDLYLSQKVIFIK